jgi:ribosome biogenesis GTPase
MTGRILSGSRNVFIVKEEENPETGENPAIYECRIKGKVLKDSGGFYNPLAPGDRVEFDPRAGLILSVSERKNVFTRFNMKAGGPQLIAANVDAALCLTTPASPRFRPRFLARLLLPADAAGIPAAVICNKTDLFPTLDGETRRKIERRLSDFQRQGYEVLRISVKTGEGMDDLRLKLKGTRAVLAGQSGCGKTSLINALLPSARQRTGPVNQKYDRGNHTTVMSTLFECRADGFSIIDTPGLRRLVPNGIAPGDVQNFMRDFAPFAASCAFGLSCKHQNEEDCKVREALRAGLIHEDRFESFARVTRELSALRFKASPPESERKPRKSNIARGNHECEMFMPDST